MIALLSYKNREKPIQLKTLPNVSQTRTTNDQDLLLLLRNPETAERGFTLLVKQYQERLYWQIRKLVEEHEDASDVLQNCFIKCYRNIGRFEGKSLLYTWMYRIAMNEAITFLKQKKRRSASSVDSPELGLANVLKADSYFDGENAQIRLQEALERLPAKQKQVFILRYFEEQSYQEISDQLNTSVGGLKASYHHAVKKIQSYLKA